MSQAILPSEITLDKDNNINIHMASFSYYDGIYVAKQLNLKQTSHFGDVMNKTHFIVCCGDVMIRVEETDYPDIKRRIM